MGELIAFVTVKNALQAIEFYKDIFSAEIAQEITMLEDVPGMEKHTGKVGHATLKIGESKFFINDHLDEYPLEQGDFIQFVLDLETEDKLRTAFDQLKVDGEVVQELQEVFWGALFGSVKDKFGITWQIHYGHK